MRDLSTVREGWDAVEAEETRLLREMTIEEGLRAFGQIQATLEHQYQQSDSLFRPDREAALIELQHRLRRLAEWRANTVEDLYQAITKIQKRFTAAGIPSAVIGGIAVSAWGEPRGTRDVDLKVLLERESAEKLLEILGEDYRPIHGEPLQALRNNGILFVLDSDGVRIDLMLADVGFDAEAISRAHEIELAPGRTGRVCTAEDLLIYKLISTRQLDHIDAESIVRRQGDKLDGEYIVGWLRQFEQALDDSTLVAEFERLRAQYTG